MCASLRWYSTKHACFFSNLHRFSATGCYDWGMIVESPVLTCIGTHSPNVRACSIHRDQFEASKTRSGLYGMSPGVGVVVRGGGVGEWLDLSRGRK